MSFFNEIIIGFLKFLLVMPSDLIMMTGDLGNGLFTNSGTGVVATIMNTLIASVKSFLPFLKGIAYMIMAMFFIMSLIDLSMSERLTMESFIKHFTYLAAGFGAVFFSEKIFETSLEFGNAFTAFVADKFVTKSPDVSDSPDFEDCLKQLVETGNLMWILLVAAGILFAGIAILIALGLLVVIYVIAFQRVIDIGVKGCLLPIGLAFLTDDGFKGAGGRYIKKFIAACCQGTVLTIITRIIGIITMSVRSQMFSTLTSVTISSDDIFTALNTFFVDAYLKGIVIMLGAALAGIAAMFKAGQYMNDAFGV